VWATGSRYQGWWKEDVAQGYGVYYRIAAGSQTQKMGLNPGDGNESGDDSDSQVLSPPLSPTSPHSPEASNTPVYEHIYKGMWMKNKKHTTVHTTVRKNSTKSSKSSSSKTGMTDADGNKVDPTVAIETYANGDIYTGQFTRGRKSGIGTYMYAADGRVERGRFADGVFQGRDEEELEEGEQEQAGEGAGEGAGVAASQAGFWSRIFA